MCWFFVALLSSRRAVRRRTWLQIIRTGISSLWKRARAISPVDGYSFQMPRGLVRANAPHPFIVRLWLWVWVTHGRKASSNSESLQLSASVSSYVTCITKEIFSVQELYCLWLRSWRNAIWRRFLDNSYEGGNAHQVTVTTTFACVVRI